MLSPCALGGVLDSVTIPRLRCRAVVGAANNQLDGPGADRELAARGILYAPDFVANAGGIINIAEEFTGYDRERALARAPRALPPRQRACSRSHGSVRSRRRAPPNGSRKSASSGRARRGGGSRAIPPPGRTVNRSARCGEQCASSRSYRMFPVWPSE